MRKDLLIWMSAALLAGGLTGCYDDKGNYDYRDINEMEYKMVPDATDGQYRLPRPMRDTLTAVYTPEVTQSLQQGEENLEFLWLVSYVDDKDENVTDTVRTKALELKFPPRKDMEYNVKFVLTDVTTNVSFYKSMRMWTVLPFTNAWMVLNSQGEDALYRISVVENPDSTQYTLTEDGNAMLGFEPRFEKARALVYGSMTYADPYSQEGLQILMDDAGSFFSVNPYALEVKTEYGKLPGSIVNNSREVLYGLDGGPQGDTYIVDDHYTLYWAGVQSNGAFQEIFGDKDAGTEGYRADYAANAKGVGVAFWDKERKEFLYWGTGDKSVNTYDKAAAEHWQDYEPVWMGRAPITEGRDKNAIAIALMKSGKGDNYRVCRLGNLSESVTKTDLGALPVDKDSQYASAEYWEDQFFYTVGGKVYVLNLDSKVSTELYDAGAPITKMEFRINETQNVEPTNTHHYRSLALVVDKGAADELHELTFTIAGDVQGAKVFTGFGDIRDICFTFMNRIE